MNSASQNRIICPSLLLFCLAFLYYLSAVCPTTYWRDAPEFQVVGYQLGIAHPAGSPFYALVTKLFTFLPLGNIAFRTNLVSAFFSALLVSLTFLLATELLRVLFPALTPGRAVFCGALAAACYAVSDSLLATAASAEVYPLQFCFVALIGLLLLRGLREPENHVPMYLAAFLFGLSIGAHIIMILFFPALCLSLFLYYRDRLSPSRFGMISFFFLLGASIYLYLPVRSSINPYYDWGNPENLQNFLIHITDRKDAKLHFTFSPARVSTLFAKYLAYYPEDFGYLGVFVGLLGLGVFLRRRPKLFLALGAFFFSTWGFFIRLWETSVMFIPTFLFFTLGVAVGLGALIEAFRGARENAYSENPARRLILGGVALIFIVHAGFSGTSHWQKNSRTAYWSPYDFNKYLCDQIEPRGVLVSTLYYFGTSYLQQCEGYRPDITNLFLSEILKPRLFNKVTPQRYPLITVPEAQGPKIGEAIINANLSHHPFYWDPTSTNNDLVKDHLHPYGVFLAIAPSPGAPTPQEEQSHRQKIEAFLSQFSPALMHYQDQEEALFYGLLLERLAQYFVDQGKFNMAVAHLLVAERLMPRGRFSVLNSLGSSFALLRRYPEAEARFQEALALAPNDPTVLQNLGQLYLDTNRTSLALAFYQKALANDQANIRTLFGLGITQERLGHRENSRHSLEQVIRLAPQDPLAVEARKKLADMDPAARAHAPNPH